MAQQKRPTVTVLLTEALDHLDRLTRLMTEWQTDWNAISPQLGNGHPNPDYDEDYLNRLQLHPEEVFDPEVIAARDFLNRVRQK